MKRGGAPDTEISHGKNLSLIDAEKIWGRSDVAGEQRVLRCANWIIDSCKIQENQNILECGCGTGIFTSKIIPTKANIVAVDISEELLAIAKTNISSHNVTFFAVDLEKTINNIPDAFLDAIYGVSILHHLDTKSALFALRQKAKQGARFAFSEPNLNNPINKHMFCSSDPQLRIKNHMSETEMAFRLEELREILNTAGFIVEKICYRDFLHPSTPRLLVPFVKLLGSIIEKLPFIKSISGSIWVSGHID